MSARSCTLSISLPLFVLQSHSHVHSLSLCAFSSLFKLSISVCLNSFTPSSEAQDEGRWELCQKSMTDMSVQLTTYTYESNKSTDFGLQLIHSRSNPLRKSFGLRSMLPNFLHPSVMSCIFLGRQIAKRVSNHCQPWPFLWKLARMHGIYCQCVGVHVFQCIFMRVHTSVLHLHK